MKRNPNMPEEFRDLEYKMSTVKNLQYEDCDGLMTIDGSGMEPAYHDGDTICFKYAASAEDGQDVLCTSALSPAKLMVKRVHNGKLISLNPEHATAAEPDENTKIVAIILGVINPDDIADTSPLAAEEQHEKNRQQGEELKQAQFEADQIRDYLLTHKKAREAVLGLIKMNDPLVWNKLKKFRADLENRNVT